MLAQDICLEIEPHVAAAIANLAAELRLVDIGDYIAYLRMEQFDCIADIVRDASEMYFTPGFIEFGNDGEASAEWGSPPEVTLMLVINSARAKAHVALKLCTDHAEVKLGYVSFDHAFDGRHDLATLLVDDIFDNMIAAPGLPGRIFFPRGGLTGPGAP
ncbi:hypothetical protein [Oricola thermophila]|uniref:Uncharacterized protein n=1 Tax=Oricola thermophila TaxID=2742145 RepID=A0A6N1VL28_9HYPH|nr:hypothetical protein [Oricola thermophila]QKV19657.1 hypothetical protein HTY61_14940 [Oricola thermophila]